jgi:hypothetical protein
MIYDPYVEIKREIVGMGRVRGDKVGLKMQRQMGEIY